MHIGDRPEEVNTGILGLVWKKKKERNKKKFLLQ